MLSKLEEGFADRKKHTQLTENMLTHNTMMFERSLVKKLAQNMGTSYSSFGKTVKSRTCTKGLMTKLLDYYKEKKQQV